jgi:hypothetical protein
LTTFTMCVGERALRFGARALRPLATVGLSAALPLIVANSALAAGSSVYADGLHISTGALVDPDGRVWVSDHNAGFCRVTDASPSGPGHIEHPQFPGDTAHGDPTCLGGLLPGAGTGPDAAQSAVAYENTDTGEQFAFIADGAAPSSDVVRAKWNAATHRYEFDGTVVMDADPARPQRSRPNSASLGPDGHVYVGFQSSGTIQRFDPALAEPVAERVGRTSDGRGSTGVAAGFDEAGATTVYVVESVGLRELHPASSAPATTPSFDVGADTIGALAYDRTRRVLYAGTANGVTQADTGADRLHRFATDTGAAELGYATGFSMIGGLGVRGNGNVFVLDDEALLDPAEPIGTGLMYLVGLPVAHITSGPTNAGGGQAADRAFTNDTTPTFTVTGDEALKCSLVPDGAVPAWQDCASGSLTPAEPLAEGPYVFSTHSENAAGAGVDEGQRFTVDTTAPAAPSIQSPVSGSTVNGSPAFTFAGESFAAYTCNLDGAADDAAAYTSCASGKAFAFGSDGTHTLRLKATDRAGNVSSASAPSTFTVDVTAPAVTISSPADGALVGASPSFAFSASEAGVTYRCRLDTQPFAACGSPHGLTAVAPGTHTFQVRATDAVGNVGPTASRTFRVGDAAADATDPPGIPAQLGPGARSRGTTPSAADAPALLTISALSPPKRISLARARRGARIAMTLPRGTTALRYTLKRGGKVVQTRTVRRRAGAYVLRLRVTRTGAYTLRVTPVGSRPGRSRTISFRVV